MSTHGVLGQVSTSITADQWLYAAAPFVLFGLVSLVLALIGSHGDETSPWRKPIRRISDALHRGTGYPGWAMAGVLSGLVMLGAGAIGLYWDVAWHINLGRDITLMTPSHTMIVLALGGLMFAALVTVVFATVEDAAVGFRWSGLVIPWSALSLASLGFGGVVAFPLDALWHEAYGIDVTLWSPTHLMLVGGGALGTIAVWLMMAEARRDAAPTWLGKVIQVTVAGAVLVGLSTVQGEFDYGVPQFQLLFWPLLVSVAAAFSLVSARMVLGRGGALATVAAFLILRGLFALIVGVALNHTVPRFPLYLVAALAVEAVALVVGTRRVLAFAVVSGFATATVGLAAEAVWTGASGWFEFPLALLPKVAVLAPVAAVAAAVLGASLARGYGGPRIPVPALAAAGVALLAVMAVPLPRNVGDVGTVIRLSPASVGSLATGQADPGSAEGPKWANVEVSLTPADAAQGAVAFGLVSWQGGGRISADLVEVSPGNYRSSEPVPVSGAWKTMVGLFRGDQVMAAPVFLPADPAIGAEEIPALAERQTRFVRNTTLFLRETRPGPLWPSLVSYGGLTVVVAGWVALFALAIVRVGVGDRRDGDDQSSMSRPRSVAGAGPAGAPGMIAWPALS
ncbi:MAG: hypothetical protein ACT4OS_05905 [Acidimicrobiales bacterium]